MKNKYLSYHKNMSSITIVKIENKWFLEAANYHIRMTSEESRDTEDWNNDAEISALCHMELITL